MKGCVTMPHHQQHHNFTLMKNNTFSSAVGRQVFGHHSLLDAAGDRRSLTEGWFESSKKSNPAFWLVVHLERLSQQLLFAALGCC